MSDRIEWLRIAVREELQAAALALALGATAHATDSIADAVVFFGRLEEALKARGDD